MLGSSNLHPKRGALVLFLVLSVALLAQAQDACKGSVGGKNYDLSKLANALAGGQAATQDGNNQQYTYKVCGNLGGLCPTATDATPAICQRDNNQNQHDCGSETKASWSRNPSGADGFILSFDGGEDGRNSRIIFTCDPNAGVGTFTYDSENPPRSFTFRWTTQYACPTGGGGGVAEVCCLYAGPSNCGSDMRTLCQDSTVSCPWVVGSYKLAYNWTLDSCDHCKF